MGWAVAVGGVEWREVLGYVGCGMGGWIWWGEGFEMGEVSCAVAWEWRSFVRDESGGWLLGLWFAEGMWLVRDLLAERP